MIFLARKDKEMKEEKTKTQKNVAKMWKENTECLFNVMRAFFAFSLFVCSDAHCANCNWMHPSSTLVYFIFFSFFFFSPLVVPVVSVCVSAPRSPLRELTQKKIKKQQQQRMQFKISKPKERKWGDGKMKEYAQVIFLLCVDTALPFHLRWCIGAEGNGPIAHEQCAKRTHANE